MGSEQKILKLDQLTSNLELLRNDQKKIVLCHGVFDLLHVGHLRYFKQARTYGDVLVVTITPDRYVDKGPERPAFNENIRAEVVAELDCVDYVAINEWPTAENTLKLLRPHFYAKGSEFKAAGSDYTGKIDAEMEVVKNIGAQIIFTEDIVFSSTHLINRFLSNMPEEVRDYLRLFRHRHNIDEIFEILDHLSSLRVLIIGDTIIDDYQYCETLGKSSKDPILALRYLSNDLFAGGGLAIANHVANFADQVHLVTVLGEKDSYREFIQQNLNPNISTEFFSKKDAPTLIKRRFLDGHSLNKLLEIYIMDDSSLPEDINQEICRWVKERISDFDLIIAADFGHGTISSKLIRILTAEAPFLAVNTQANAGNRRFHTISRYPRVNFLCLAEHEIRLEARNLNGPLRPIMERLAKKLSVQRLVITMGRKGCLVYGLDGNFINVPSRSSTVVDRIGAGDAFFSLTSLAAAQGVNDEILGFIGNVAGAQAVNILGNQKSINKMNLKKFITTLLK
ncbi:MAG: adenylyltransferase/cytidyltransferase family protein [Deltaproteobacteria bacterium]|nr:adenylyltransferase/cytidyltransferase family protein [Deltaproteobacteria bacterium]